MWGWGRWWTDIVTASSAIGTIEAAQRVIYKQAEDGGRLPPVCSLRLVGGGCLFAETGGSIENLSPPSAEESRSRTEFRIRHCHRRHHHPYLSRDDGREEPERLPLPLCRLPTDGPQRRRPPAMDGTGRCPNTAERKKKKKAVPTERQLHQSRLRSWSPLLPPRRAFAVIRRSPSSQHRIRRTFPSRTGHRRGGKRERGRGRGRAAE